MMKCRRCGSTNVIMTIVNESRLVKDKPGCIWWMLIGWWWIPVKWIYFTIAALILKIFVPAKMKLYKRQYTEAVCQRCGYHWRVR